MNGWDLKNAGFYHHAVPDLPVTEEHEMIFHNTNTSQMLHEKNPSKYCSMTKTGDGRIMSYAKPSFFFLFYPVLYDCCSWIIHIGLWFLFVFIPALGNLNALLLAQNTMGLQVTKKIYKILRCRCTLLETRMVIYYLRWFWKCHKNSIGISRHYPQRQFEHFLMKTFVPDNPFKS